ncbi:TRAP transporter 4TM/12TM fusion protein [Roseibium hamelinense]|uniref:TRAP transporter 4TM/12TM fusion protein n=1 Tax=Roseibium hamelinense TaxID=150831 RepID=A0A562TIQ9_9HYPH|nr:TRAP transporter permease [Roseibium hamelinense]MTI45729.1 TRAP transporter fused permease subunit [Roseibium hamelinense]TWI93088.1 TRAP transporter 4TM/12TM fusion protein [Roseibium hamelinense]
MSDNVAKDAGTASNEIDLQELVAQSDTGARNPAGAIGLMLSLIALSWSLFQLYYASTLPFLLTDLIGINVTLNSDTARSVHLAFALFLATMAYPLFKNSSRTHVPWYDWVLSALAVTACMYLVFNKEAISARAGLPTQADLIISTIGLLSVLIATYRALGLPLVIVASVFLFYVFFGDQPFIPEVIQWKGASYGKAMWHYWMQTEGVFGIALGVSASMIFLFVLFGAMLDQAGAGNYFIKVAFALLGHLRGGPAKAAVVSSAMTGLISGSSIANTVTTGTFTIPLMKRVGFKPETAGAVEVSSSVNGQIMPPVMGAAAFLMVEYVGVTYLDVVRHAILPASISYIALLYIVHLEALKAGMQGLPKPGPAKTVIQSILGVLTGFLSLAILAAVLHYGLGWTKQVFGDSTFEAVIVIFLAAYLGLLFVASKRPDLELDDPDAPVTTLPEFIPTLLTGLYYLLPIIVLVWCLMIERFSPGLSAYWASVGMILILLTQKPIKALMRASGNVGAAAREGVADLIKGLISGARNMIGIAVATAAAGIIVGTISLTGAHQIMGEFIEFLSGGNLMLMLVLVAIFSLILGMGLPTTANYIVVSSLMAGVVVEIGAMNGLIVPLIAVHLFVFYFGLMADVTPPVGLASFAAAAISRGDPIKTGFTAFFYSLRTVALPFLFIFNTDLLLIDVGPIEAVFVFFVATIAMMLFAAGTQGYFFARNKIWEAVALLLIAFTLFRPGFWLDMVQPPYVSTPPATLFQTASDVPDDGYLKLVVRGPDFDNPDQFHETFVELPLGAKGDGENRVTDAGLTVMMEGDKAVLEEPFPGTPYFEKFSSFDFYGDQPVEVIDVQEQAERLPKEVFYIPALLLLFGVVALQRRRTDVPAF